MSYRRGRGRKRFGKRGYKSHRRSKVRRFYTLPRGGYRL